MAGIGQNTVSEGITNTQAFAMIEELGFLHPKKEVFPLYFKWCVDKTLVPIVNFETLKVEIVEKKLADKMAEVVGLPYNNPEKKRVMDLILDVIKGHRIED